jgi:general secretion pathway protein B
MSFILDALKKAEQERSLGRAPDLQTIHSLPEPPRRRFWPWLLGAALLINAAVLSILLIGFGNPDSNVLSNPLTSSLTTTTANNEPVRSRESAATVAAHTDTATEVSSGSLAALPEPRLTTTESLLPRAPLETSSADSSWSSLEIPQTDPYGLTQPDFQTQLQDEFRNAQSASVPELTSRQPAADSRVLPLQAMPADFRNALPILNLDVHVYSAQPERRFVLINSKRYQQGEHLDEGPRLETITEDGVILSFLNQRFSLNVQR